MDAISFTADDFLKWFPNEDQEDYPRYAASLGREVVMDLRMF